MKIVFDRESVAYADDITGHEEIRELPDAMKLSELLVEIGNYLPWVTGKTVWIVTSKDENIIGMIYKVENECKAFDCENPKQTLAEVFNAENQKIYCHYFYNQQYQGDESLKKVLGNNKKLEKRIKKFLAK